MLRPLKPSQQATLDYITLSIAEKGYAPTLRDISKGTNMALATVFEHAGLLQARGFIERDEKIARSIRLVPRGGKN